MFPMWQKVKSGLSFYRTTLKVVFVLAILIAAAWLVLVVTFRPSHNRDWELGQEQLPLVELVGDQVTIRNFRNFDWQAEGKATVRYETRVFDLDKMRSVDVLISHFDDFEGLAHIFLSFGFADGEQIVISLETRRELGEEFSPWLGLLRQFEIIYVVGSEEDIVGLRTDIRDERVYLYPTVASAEQARALFLKVSEDINDVYYRPRVYNTLVHNCTNELTRRVEEIADVKFPLTWKSILPGYFDEVLYGLGIIRQQGNFSETKKYYRVDNAQVNRYSSDFHSSLRKYE